MNIKKILVIDDEVDFGKIIKMNLELIDDTFEVHLATNGKDGLKRAASVKPDVIILDILMPHMNGFQVLEKLKNDMNTTSIPVIMLTAKDDDESKEKAFELYNELFITKPIDTPDLKAKIDSVLNRGTGF